MLTEAGLSTIVTAIIGARKIFQRMNTYVCPLLAYSVLGLSLQLLQHMHYTRSASIQANCSLAYPSASLTSMYDINMWQGCQSHLHWQSLTRVCVRHLQTCHVLAALHSLKPSELLTAFLLQAKYTVAMTFRICFTFGILTVVYDWCVAKLCLFSCNLQLLSFPDSA